MRLRADASTCVGVVLLVVARSQPKGPELAKLARIPRIWIAALAVAAAALTLAFVLLPGLVLGSPNAVPSSLAAGLSAFWDSGDGAMPPALVALIDYWREWHVIKVLLSGLLVAVSIVTSVILWSRFRAAERAGGAASAVGGTISTLVAVIAGGLLAINIQATAVPFVALFPLVPVSPDDASERQSLGELRASLANDQAGSGHETVRQLVLNQVWQYTAVNAAVMAALAVTAAALAIALFIRFVRAVGDDRTRIMCLAISPLLGISALAYFAISALSVLSAMDASSSASGLLGG